jgi:hypothetical protein
MTDTGMELSRDAHRYTTQRQIDGLNVMLKQVSLKTKKLTKILSKGFVKKNRGEENKKR